MVFIQNSIQSSNINPIVDYEKSGGEGKLLRYLLQLFLKIRNFFSKQQTPIGNL